MAKYKIVETKEGRFVEVTTTKPYLIEGKIIEKGRTLLINEKGILGSLDGEFESIAAKAKMARIKKAMSADLMADEELVDEPSIDPDKKPMKKMDPVEVPEDKEEVEGVVAPPPAPDKEAMRKKFSMKALAKKAMEAEDVPEEDLEDLADMEDVAEEDMDGVDVEVSENEEGENEVEIEFEEPKEEITISAMRKMMLANKKKMEEPEEEPEEEEEVEEKPKAIPTVSKKEEMRRPIRRAYQK